MTQLGIQKDVWGIIEQYSKPTLWWYWCKDPNRFRDGLYSNMAEEFKVIEASCEQQARFIIIRSTMHKYMYDLQFGMGVKSWKKIHTKYENMFSDGCHRCELLKNAIYATPDDRNTTIDPDNYCVNHPITEEMLVYGIGLTNVTHWTQITKTHFDRLMEALNCLIDQKWVIIKKLHW